MGYANNRLVGNLFIFKKVSWFYGAQYVVPSEPEQYVPSESDVDDMISEEQDLDVFMEQDVDENVSDGDESNANGSDDVFMDHDENGFDGVEGSESGSEDANGSDNVSVHELFSDDFGEDEYDTDEPEDASEQEYYFRDSHGVVLDHDDALRFQCSIWVDGQYRDDEDHIVWEEVDDVNDPREWTLDIKANFIDFIIANNSFDLI